MRLLSGAAALAAATLFGTVTANPNFEVSKTSVDIDRHREKLDKGEIVVRVQRTQDLFSDPTADSAAKLLLERDTHLFLKIQLDADNGKINVNDASLDIAGDDKTAPITVAGIKAETFRLPGDPDSSVLGMSVEEVQGLVEQMSTGIVGVEVKVESQPITPSVPVVNFDDNSGAPSIGAVTIRQVGLWIRITEVEGKSLPHTTSIFTPILQLIVTGSGNKVEKIETLAIDGKAPIENKAHYGLGPAMVESLPAVEGDPGRARPYDRNGELVEDPQHHHHGHHHPHHGHGEGDKRPSFGILGWIARTLDISRWGRPSRAGAHRPCRGRKGMMRGGDDASKMNDETAPGKVVGHRPMLDNPFSGVADDDEGYESGTEARKEIKHHMRPHYPSHNDGMPPHHRFGNKKHHGRCGSFFKRMAIGLVYGFAMLGAILMHPITLLSISALSAFAVVFHVVRRIVIKKRQGAVRLGSEEEEGLLEDDKAPLMGDKEVQGLREVVVVEGEEVPRYEESS